MIDLLFANIIYVSYRLFITGPIIKFLESRLTYYGAVIVAAQISFLYDSIVFYNYFQSFNFDILELVISDLQYTLRVIAAWWLIAQIRKLTNNFYLSVFIGAQITFVFDYFIFNKLFN